MFIFRFPSSNGRATVSNSSNRAAGAAVVATKVVTTVVTVTMATGAMATSRADGVAMEAVVAVAIRMKKATTIKTNGETDLYRHTMCILEICFVWRFYSIYGFLKIT